MVERNVMSDGVTSVSLKTISTLTDDRVPVASQKTLVLYV